jgi:hypothetical protein
VLFTMLKFRLGLLVALALVLAAGCNRSNAPAKISGKVTYNGQPLKGGEIAFHSENMGTYRSSLAEDGSYDIVDMPAGPMTVTIETDSLNPDKKVPGYPGSAGGRPVVGAGAAKGAAMDKERAAAERKAGVGGPPTPEQMRARYTKIPKKYADRTASPLKVDVTAGKQTKDFDLTD